MARQSIHNPSPALARAIEQVRRLDPLLVEAADDVDVHLLKWFLSLPPLERLRLCTRATTALARFRGGGTEVGWATGKEDTVDQPSTGVVRNPKGIPVISGTNTKVVELISHVKSFGGDPAEICEQLPHLSVEQVKAALAFYEDHRQEIDDDLARRSERAERLRREMPEAPIVEKIRRLRGEG